MLIDKHELCSLIPHAGAMCLLDGVLEWDDETIVCTTRSHRDAANPLRREGRLACVHLLEYGAQAMAVHGGLLARRHGGRIGAGFVAALHDVSLHRAFVDEVLEPLMVRAHKLAISSECLMYRFNVASGGQTLAAARATIFVRSTDAAA